MSFTFLLALPPRLHVPQTFQNLLIRNHTIPEMTQHYAPALLKMTELTSKMEARPEHLAELAYFTHPGKEKPTGVFSLFAKPLEDSPFADRALLEQVTLDFNNHGDYPAFLQQCLDAVEKISAT